MTTMRWLCFGLLVPAFAPLAIAQDAGKVVPRGDGIYTYDFSIGKQLVTRYHMNTYSQPIFWPVHAPGGQMLTRAWPMSKTIAPGGSSDHLHHKSLWFCHGDVIPEGMKFKHKIKGVAGVDFWSEAPGHGRIVTTRVEPSGATHNEWRTADGVKILDEDRGIECYDLGNAWLLVLQIDLHATVAPITFGDTKEGALGSRINDAIRAGKYGKGKIENALGKLGEKECWGHIADWCDYSGPIDGKTVGLAVLADPKNAYPSYWHVRDYGLMAANPFGRKKPGFHDGAANQPLVRLKQGEHLRLRYGVLLHNGDAHSGQVAQQYQRFVKMGEKK